VAPNSKKALDSQFIKAKLPPKQRHLGKLVESELAEKS